MQQACSKLQRAETSARICSPFTVIVPACNEASVIGRCLESIYDGADDNASFEVIVVANGCTDQTADQARNSRLPCKVIEIGQASKVQAINLGIELAAFRPCLVVDADITTSHATLAATAAALSDPAAMVASPQLQVDLSRCSAAVRAYYDIWLRLPYANDGLIGGGIYGISQAGLEQIGKLPEVVADDLYVRTRFEREMRRKISIDALGRPAFSLMRPPESLLDLVRIEARRLRGKLQVDRHYPTPQSGTINGPRALLRAWQTGARGRDLAVFVLVKTGARLRYLLDRMRGRHEWSKDSSSRIS